MLTEKQAEEILRSLSQLPTEKVAAAHDFILYLQAQYGHGILDESDRWTDEDLRDFTAAAMGYANHAASARDGE